MARRSRAVRAVKTNAGFEGRGLIGEEKDSGWGGRLGPAFAVWDAACVVARGWKRPRLNGRDARATLGEEFGRGAYPASPSFLGRCLGFARFFACGFRGRDLGVLTWPSPFAASL